MATLTMSTPHTYQDVVNFMIGKQSRHIGNNTTIDARGNGVFDVRLHRRVIVTYMPEEIHVYSGGYQSNTTKDRLNRLLPTRVWQKDFVWYIGTDTSFEDGMTIPWSAR